MIQRDYVLRLIAEAAQAVALALRLRQRGDDAGAEAHLDAAARGLAGLPLDALARLDGPALRDRCAPGGAFQPERAVALADVLRAAGDLPRARTLYAAAHAAGAALPLHGLALAAPPTLDGRRTVDFPAFADEVNRSLAPLLSAPWNGTLDALTDLLGEAFAAAPGPLVWAHADAARAALGHDRMADWLETRVAFVHPTNRSDIEARLVEARHHHGPTLFEMLADLMAAVPGLTLRLDAGDAPAHP